MAINDKQKAVLIVGLLLIGLMGLFPPWRQLIVTKKFRVDQSLGYGFLAVPPREGYGVKVDYSRLMTQWLIVSIATTVLVLLLGNGHRKDRPATKGAGSQNAGSLLDTYKEESSAFLGGKRQRYISKFQKFARRPNDQFALSWNWAAFLANFWWAFYRKLYGWGILLLLLNIALTISFRIFPNRTFVIFGLSIDLMCGLIFGMAADYIYYAHIKKQVVFLRSDVKDMEERLARLEQLGGINNSVRHLALGVIAVAITLIALAIGIPQYYEKYNSLARRSLNSADFAELVYYWRHRTYTDSIAALKSMLYLPEGVELKILYSSKENYRLVAYHKRGDKIYILEGPRKGVKIKTVAQRHFMSGTQDLLYVNWLGGEITNSVSRMKTER